MTTNQARLPGPRAGRPAPVRRPDAPPDTETTSKRDGPVALPVPDNTIGLDMAAWPAKPGHAGPAVKAA